MPKNALIFCEGGFSHPVGKTAHGLIRHSKRYRIVGVIDSTVAGRDAGVILDGKPRGIPVFKSIEDAIEKSSTKPEVMIVGLAPTGFNGEASIIYAAETALLNGLSVHSGLHLFLSDLPELQSIARDRGLVLLDVRKPPSRRLQMLSGKILGIKAPRLLVTGQDAAVGKRTTAIRLSEELAARGVHTCLIGTGQTAWLQGIDYGIRLDALPLDFAGGELEAEVVKAYEQEVPDIIIIEGQGSLLNPGYSCETMILLTTCLPSMLVYVAAPERSHYVDFPEFKMRDAEEEMRLLEALSGASIMGVVVHCQSATLLRQEYLRSDVPVALGADGDLGPIAESVKNFASPQKI
jgi:uncharacterized NAD-dependent epimerase/dehydratase family protein